MQGRKDRGGRWLRIRHHRIAVSILALGRDRGWSFRLAGGSGGATDGSAPRGRGRRCCGSSGGLWDRGWVVLVLSLEGLVVIKVVGKVFLGAKNLADIRGVLRCCATVLSRGWAFIREDNLIVATYIFPCLI
jgi:hypothetical protein